MGASHLDLEQQLQAISGRGDCARHRPSRPARHKHPAQTQHTWSERNRDGLIAHDTLYELAAST